MNSNNDNIAVVWGAGGIGTALAKQINAGGRYRHVVLVSRRQVDSLSEGIDCICADMLDEASLEQAFKTIAERGKIKLLVVATGILHDGEIQPEKTIRHLTLEAFQKVVTVNAIGPALIAKHFAFCMPLKERTVFAAISARVGSISDNRLGGWYAYRASKAALNMLIKTLSIEWQRRNPNAICIGLHPGTVDTDLSGPFQSGVKPDKLFTTDHAAKRLLEVIELKTADESGNVFAFDGTKVPE